MMKCDFEEADRKAIELLAADVNSVPRVDIIHFAIREHPLGLASFV
jgi:hypothetical protein